MARPKKGKQQTLEATLGRPRVKSIVRAPGKRKDKVASGSSVFSSPPKNAASVSSSPPAPPSSFMRSSQVPGSTRKKRVLFEDSSSEEAREDERERLFPVPTRGGKGPQLSGSESESGSSAGSPKKGKETRKDSEDDDDEDDDDKPLPTPVARRKRRLVASESDEDEQPLISPPIKRRRLIRRNVISSPTKEGKEDEDAEEPPTPSSVRTGRARRKPLTAKEKARELLRRKRAGEVINEDDDSLSSDDEEPGKAMYDSDSDHLVLDEFEDDEEGINEPKLEEATERRKSKKKRKRNTVDDDDDDNESESTDDFVVDDDDAPLGVPEEAYQNMPLEFTKHSQKSLKEYFRDAIEWLVQFMVNPGFPDKEHPVYRMAWKKLDDEVRGLATSKFASAAWRKDFYMALRARPHFNNVELSKGEMLSSQHCGACGRTSHPAKYLMTFTGTPYYKSTTNLERFLRPVEMDSESDSGSDPHDDDEDGNPIPKEDKEWFVGMVCNSNAETTHDLMHWKHGLLTFVDTRLHIEGHMHSDKVAEREHMLPEQMDEFIDKIMGQWEKNGMVKALYHEFKGTIESARNKPTSRKYR